MRFPLLLLALACGSTLAAAPQDRPLPPKDAAKAITLAPGFHATLFAGEPDVVQPIAMTFDDRGRLWVVECFSYPNWSKDGTGKDRVLILEDTNHDGTFDKRTVFYDKGSNLSGIEFGFGGIWLCSIPNLIFIADRNGDDAPDGPPEIVLDGWDLKDIGHNVYNSLGWGPDGWLYGCHGIKGTSRVGAPGTAKEKRTPMNCGVWRYHPTRRVFEAYAHGTTNPFGLDWDDYGQMFMTNCVIDHMWHVIPGAHFQRMYGEDLNPYVYGYLKSCVDHLHWGGGSWTSSRNTGETGGKTEHSEAGGGHAHAGCAVYLGNNFPPEYRNSVFMANIHGNRLNRDRLERTDRGYVAKHEKDFLHANDPWFRGICVKQGPDGSLYTSDWTDTGECHNYKEVDQANGRIYKVTFGKPAPWTKDLAKAGDEELVKLAIDPTNEWASRHARRLLQERAAAGTLTKDAEVWDSVTKELIAPKVEKTRTLRALWTLFVTNRLSLVGLRQAVSSDDLEVRAWGIQIISNMLVEEPSDPQELFKLILMQTGRERSPYVRGQFASLMQKVPSKDAFELANRLFSHPEDNANHNLSWMYWYGIQPAVLAEPEKALAIAASSSIQRVRENIVRLVLTRPGVDLPAALTMLVKAVAATTEDRPRQDMLAGVVQAVAGKRDLKAPAEWHSLSVSLRNSRSKELRAVTEDLDVSFGDNVTIDLLRKRVQDARTSPEDRAAAAGLLVRHKVPGLAPLLLNAIDDLGVRRVALRALASYHDPKAPAVILSKYAGFDADGKADAIQTLASRASYTSALLDAVEKGTVPRTDIPVVAARQILALNDKPTSERLTKLWGVINPVGKNRSALLAKWRPLLEPAAMKSASEINGKAVFAKSCAACHKLFGEGGDVGPDLTGAQRASLDYVLENVLDPNAVVAREYMIVNFTLADGRSIGGIVKGETPHAVTVRTVNDTLVSSKADIESRTPTKQSIMPEGLFDALKPDDVRDLVAYLASRK